MFSKGKIAFLLCFIIILTGLVCTSCAPDRVVEVSISYPKNGTIFPPGIVPPTFLWSDPSEGVEGWVVKLDFPDSLGPLEFRTDTQNWIPDKDSWENIKQRSLEKDVRISVSGFRLKKGKEQTVSRNMVTIKTSRDEVGAPIFYRDVPLPFDYALEHTDFIKWRLGEISAEEPPKVLLENMIVCGNCHSFSADGRRMGMDVDYANDKGS